MTPRDPALEVARRIAAGTEADVTAVGACDPKLARGLARIAAIARTLGGHKPVGATWGHLQGLQFAGAGTFGEVYRAWDPTLDRVVALKLKRRDAPDAIFSGRDFVAEARRLARVRHPNVLGVHGAGYHDDRAGLWADWIDGQTLRARLATERTLPPALLLNVAAELAGALAAVHAAGIVHGDLSATNVMLDAEGRAVLMDFGAGFVSGDEAARPAAGTPHYLAPETVRGEPLSPAIDVYALGVLLHRCACGDYPHAGVPAATLPRPWRPLLAAMLAGDPRDRPRATEVQARIEALRTAPLRRARLAMRGALSIGLLAVAATTMVGYWQAEAARVRIGEALTRAQMANAFLGELLGLAAADALGPDARLRELLDAAPALVAAHGDLAALDRAQLLSQLAELEAGLANDEAAARLAGDAARLAASAAPGSDEALRLAGDALRLRAVAGEADSAVGEGTDLLARAEAEDRPAALRAELAFDLAEAEYRLSLQRASPELGARMRARIESVLGHAALLDARIESVALRRLANLLVEAGDEAAALAAARRAVAQSTARLGRMHPSTAAARRVCGWIELSVGRYADAVEGFRTNLRLHEARLGSRSRTVVDDRIGLAYAVHASGSSGEALAMARTAWNDANALYRSDHRTTIDAGLVLGATLAAVGELTAARDVLRDLEARLRAAGRERSRQYLHVTRELAGTCERLGLARDAAVARQACRRAGLEAYGAAHELTARCLPADGGSAAAPAGSASEHTHVRPD